jgi:prepilin-type N-terminal cleavage/methylation domain-containing protein
MTKTQSHRPPTNGFTLIELIIALVLVGLIMGTALNLFRSQSSSFRVGSTKMEATQNMRFALGTIDRALRTLGSGTTSRQPMLIYGGNDVIVFNANFATDTADGDAVYVNPDLPPNAALSMTTASLTTIHGTAITYPDTNYYWGPSSTPSRAETISFYFEPDISTSDPNDYALMQQVNDLAPELVARNLKPYPSRPFFEFWYDLTLASGNRASRQLPASMVPVRHVAPIHGSPADTAASALADSIRIVRVNFVATNGLTGPDASARTVSTMVAIPNNGLVNLATCGSRPLLAGPLTVTPNAPGNPPAAHLIWTPSVDETSGETDVTQYNVYNRLTTATEWELVGTTPPGQNPYDITTGTGLVAGQTYKFAVGAQDCTPRESTMIVSAATFIPF